LLCIVSQKTLRTDGRRSQTCTPTLVIKPIFNKNEGAGSKGEYIYVEFPQLGVVERFQEGTDFEVNAWCTRAFDFTNVAYPTHFKITNHFNDDVVFDMINIDDAPLALSTTLTLMLGQT
jgi:hypothetical protein